MQVYKIGMIILVVGLFGGSLSAMIVSSPRTARTSPEPKKADPEIRSFYEDITNMVIFELASDNRIKDKKLKQWKKELLPKLLQVRDSVKFYSLRPEVLAAINTILSDKSVSPDLIKTINEKIAKKYLDPLGL